MGARVVADTEVAATLGCEAGEMEEVTEGGG